MNNYDVKGWADICALRYDWANAGFESFMKKFDPELYLQENSAAIKDQISVVVYGSSQVGKTSFILELLGVCEDKIKRVQKVLRGGRTAGNSSTATATRYHISQNDLWHIVLKDDRNDAINTIDKYKDLGDKEATEVIGRIRQDMVELGSKYQVTEIDIYIPKLYVDKRIFNQYAHKDIIIRDLPGVNAQNHNEQHYVISSIAKKINMADIVILITKVDDLAKIIHPNNLHSDKFPMLENWWHRPNKFRAVFTSAFSNQSNRELIDKASNNQIEIAKLLKDDLVEQCKRFEIGFGSSQLYLLEVGDSWQGLVANESNSSYASKIIPIKNYFFNELRESILSANNPLSRLKYGYEIGNIAESLLRDAENRNKEEVKNIENKISKNAKRMQDFYRYIEENKMALDDLKQLDEKRGLEDGRKSATKSINDALKEVRKQPSPQKKVSALKDYLIRALRPLEEIYFKEFQDDNFEHEEVKFCFRMLSNYSLDDYFFDSSFDKDFASVKHAYENQADWLKELVDEKYQSLIKQKEREKAEMEERILLELRQLKNGYTEYENQQKALENQINNLNRKYQQFCQQRNNDIEYSKNFNLYMQKSLNDHIKQYSNIAGFESNLYLKMLWIMFIRLIKNDKDKVCTP